ncbi:uncharacterized protein HKW66_Vig0196770 [Vigna angularis]|uniref:Cwf19-like C-terminal domain-containing protein n=1 Tax=Phaseolus angularis TaxID=3914 RepID=A0A8T0KML0_PHAAN|nr:uncharacterized protein HKW66_Vig0196770 [Vigna angularis]
MYYLYMLIYHDRRIANSSFTAITVHFHFDFNCLQDKREVMKTCIGLRFFFGVETENLNRTERERKRDELDKDIFCTFKLENCGKSIISIYKTVTWTWPILKSIHLSNRKTLKIKLFSWGLHYSEPSQVESTKVKQISEHIVKGFKGNVWCFKPIKRHHRCTAAALRHHEQPVFTHWYSVGSLEIVIALKSRKDLGRRSALLLDKSAGLGNNDSGSGYPEEKDGAKVGADQLLSSSLDETLMRLCKKGGVLWRKSHQRMVAEGAGIISAAVSSLNKFSNDGSFMQNFGSKMSNNSDGSVFESVELEEVPLEANTPVERSAEVKNEMSANQLAAKAMQLRLKGKHEEAEKLMQEVKVINTKQENQDHSIRSRTDGSSSRYLAIPAAGQKKGEDDADMHLARKIMQNKKFSISTQADDEYDFEDGPSRKSRKKQAGDDGKIQKKTNRFLTQQERCLFCLENPNRPMHLVVSIANFTYLMLPQWQPVVPGHCCILPIQHESATRTVDDNVWTEIRNFKKCLIMMFAKQEKEVVFLETVMGLAQQRRHCMVECIPLPQDIAKEAPLYFKKAIDEAEDEWSQHNAKKLIDTSQKGLRNSIPKHFPYFHVEFGLNKGFVHVIDDEKQFNGSLGLNVLRGMLQLAEEDMYRRRRYEAMEVQKQLVASFSKDLEHQDQTLGLH